MVCNTYILLCDIFMSKVLIFLIVFGLGPELETDQAS
jgi:hypothetical protein